MSNVKVKNYWINKEAITYHIKSHLCNAEPNDMSNAIDGAFCAGYRKAIQDALHDVNSLAMIETEEEIDEDELPF